MLKNMMQFGTPLTRAQQKQIKGSRLTSSTISDGWCSSNCYVVGADCSEMFGPTKTCRRISCDSEYILACY